MVEVEVKVEGEVEAADSATAASWPELSFPTVPERRSGSSRARCAATGLESQAQAIRPVSYGASRMGQC